MMNVFNRNNIIAFKLVILVIGILEIFIWMGMFLRVFFPDNLPSMLISTSLFGFVLPVTSISCCIYHMHRYDFYKDFLKEFAFTIFIGLFASAVAVGMFYLLTEGEYFIFKENMLKKCVFIVGSTLNLLGALTSFLVSAKISALPREAFTNEDDASKSDKKRKKK